MLPAWWGPWVDTAMLALESQSAIGPQAKAERMVREKVLAAGEAVLPIATGASTSRVIAGCRGKVRQNRRRPMRVHAGP